MPTVPCLFCLRSGGRPSVEHVIPAGLGPHADVLLPPGAVCEDCNNDLGRQVDEALVHEMGVLLIKGMWQVPNRNGKRIREIPLRSGELKFGATGELQITRYVTDPPEDHPPGSTMSFDIAAQRGEYRDQQRRIARAILKIGLGLAWHTRGPGYAFHPDFDPARRAVLGDSYAGFLLTSRTEVDVPPDLHVSLLHDIPGIRLASRLDYGWMHFMVDMLPQSIPSETRAWADANGWKVTEVHPPLG